jgi:heat shock protein HtpX
MGNQIKTVFLLTFLTLLLVFIGNIFAGKTGMIFMLIISLGFNFFSYWYSDTIVLKMYKAKKVDNKSAVNLMKLVEGLSKKANIPVPTVYIIEDSNPNAFATGRNPEHAAIAVTTGILSLLSNKEMKGVLAHEISHIVNRDILISTIVASIAGLISTIGNIAQWSAIFGGFSNDDDNDNNIFTLIVTVIVAPVIATLVQLSISRTREFMADNSGALLTKNPLALASALVKIDAYAHKRPMKNANSATAHIFIINPLAGSKKTFANLFSTHPSTEERVAKLKKLACRFDII